MHPKFTSIIAKTGREKGRKLLKLVSAWRPTGLCFLFCLIACNLHAQLKRMTIIVTDNKGQPVAFATVKALQNQDSTVKTQKVTDSYGAAVMQFTRYKKYTLLASSVSYLPATSVVTIGNADTILLVLLPLKANVGNVVVTTTRPIMRQEDDKTIVDPENLAASSTNAYEILEKTPGLFVDQDGNVYLSSTPPPEYT